MANVRSDFQSIRVMFEKDFRSGVIIFSDQCKYLFYVVASGLNAYFLVAEYRRGKSTSHASPYSSSLSVPGSRGGLLLNLQNSAATVFGVVRRCALLLYTVESFVSVPLSRNMKHRATTNISVYSYILYTILMDFNITTV